MVLDIDDWTEDEIEQVEEHLSLVASMYSMSAEEVIGAVRREAKIKEANRQRSSGGRPSKVEKHKIAIEEVLDSDVDDHELLVKELKETILDAVDDLSRQTELDLRRELEKEYNVGFKKPFDAFSDEEFEELWLLAERTEKEN